MNEKQIVKQPKGCKQKKKNKEKYLIYCPNCKSTFDTSEQMNIWRQEFIECLDKCIEELRGSK